VNGQEYISTIKRKIMEVYSIDLKVRYRKNPDDHIEQILENTGFEVLACVGYVDPDYVEEN
tara:strand:- start:351 stop:533 length:183 start_codon:yes stop_codon:yes gene_type:complete